MSRVARSRTTCRRKELGRLTATLGAQPLLGGVYRRKPCLNVLDALTCSVA
jgi:hypothetical protein